ncbi:MAG: phosphatidylglycerophosphatase A [bacterium]|nr:phosphatidylglycerophosphatase A [bacterium]
MGIKIGRFITIYLSSLSFVGYITFFPGTFGTLIAIPFYLYLSKINISILMHSLILMFLLIAGGIICHLSERYFNQKDPPQIILDEFLGYLVAIFLIPFNLENVLISFALFRFLDIKKPLFISKIQAIPGGIGILADDLAAGATTNLVLQIYQLI